MAQFYLLSLMFQINEMILHQQEALEDREKQIQSLLADREFEQAEVASATNQVAKV